jgi:hypothetical protein
MLKKSTKVEMTDGNDDMGSGAGGSGTARGWDD